MRFGSGWQQTLTGWGVTLSVSLIMQTGILALGWSQEWSEVGQNVTVFAGVTGITVTPSSSGETVLRFESDLPFTYHLSSIDDNHVAVTLIKARLADDLLGGVAEKGRQHIKLPPSQTSVQAFIEAQGILADQQTLVLTAPGLGVGQAKQLKIEGAEPAQAFAEIPVDNGFSKQPVIKKPSVYTKDERTISQLLASLSSPHTHTPNSGEVAQISGVSDLTPPAPPSWRLPPAKTPDIISMLALEDGSDSTLEVPRMASSRDSLSEEKALAQLRIQDVNQAGLSGRLPSLKSPQPDIYRPAAIYYSAADERPESKPASQKEQTAIKTIKTLDFRELKNSRSSSGSLTEDEWQANASHQNSSSRVTTPSNSQYQGPSIESISLRGRNYSSGSAPSRPSRHPSAKRPPIISNISTGASEGDDYFASKYGYQKSPPQSQTLQQIQPEQNQTGQSYADSIYPQLKKSRAKALPRYEGGAPPISFTVSSTGKTVTLPNAPVGNIPMGFYETDDITGQALRDAKNNDPLAALGKVTAALSSDPDSPALLAAQAELYAKLERYSESTASYKQAYDQVKPGDSLAPKVTLGYLSALYRSGQTNEAMSVAQKVLTQQKESAVGKKEPYLFDLHLMLGTLYQSQGNRDKAVQHLQTAVGLTPSSAKALSDAQYNLALAYEIIGNRVLAMSHYAQALKLNPADEAAAKGLARIQQ
ncbi:MAG: tetratricopeptide repeat protein [Vampirovibrio sp.]|nr:tetratricopeptide repeat protein [Vampirovibrio sp.]